MALERNHAHPITEKCIFHRHKIWDEQMHRQHELLRDTFGMLLICVYAFIFIILSN